MQRDATAHDESRSHSVAEYAPTPQWPSASDMVRSAAAEIPSPPDPAASAAAVIESPPLVTGMDEQRARGNRLRR